MTQKQNIIIIMADQLAAQALSLYGNPVCKTPNIDRLARQGVTFERNYSNNPLCVPSRASMLSGRLSPDIRVYDNANELASSVPTMAHYMSALGYETFLSGKMHFIGPDQLHGFDERLTTDVYPANFQWIADWGAGAAFVPSGTALNGVVEAGPCIRTMQEDYDDEVEYQARRKLYDLARRDEQKPFFGIVSFTTPHTPFNVSQKYWDLYDHDTIGQPTVGAIPFADLDYFSKALFFAHGRHRHTVTNADIANTRHAYFAMISYLDEKVGRLLDQLDEIGFAANTTIMFVSDHGEMLGERGMWFKQCFWEWSARVPLIVAMPGVEQGTRVSETTSLVDLLPTIIDIGGGLDNRDMIERLDGNSLVPLLQGNSDKWIDTAIADYLAIGPCVPCRMVQKGQFKYMMTRGHPDLMFDLDNDPNELADLGSDPEYSPVLAELKAIAMRDYDSKLLTKQVIASQQERLFIALTPGAKPEWDYIAYQGDDARFVRKDGVDATKTRLRLPRAVAIPPDMPDLTPETIERMMAGEISFEF